MTVKQYIDDVKNINVGDVVKYKGEERVVIAIRPRDYSCDAIIQVIHPDDLDGLLDAKARYFSECLADFEVVPKTNNNSNTKTGKCTCTLAQVIRKGCKCGGK